MNERIKSHVDTLFAQAPRTRKAEEMKDELTSNLTERYNDLVTQGQDEETAYKAVIAGIGDMDELIGSLREQAVFDPIQIQIQRQKSALLVSIAVAIYIVSIIFPIIFGIGFVEGGVISEDVGGVIGVVLMFIGFAAATMLLVYNAMTRPKYVKMEETMVEDFKEWKSKKTKSDVMRKSIQSMIWMIAVLVYLSIGMFANVWSPTWLVFLLAPIVNHIIKLVYTYREDD